MIVYEFRAQGGQRSLTLGETEATPSPETALQIQSQKENGKDEHVEKEEVHFMSRRSGEKT